MEKTGTPILCGDCDQLQRKPMILLKALKWKNASTAMEHLTGVARITLTGGGIVYKHCITDHFSGGRNMVYKLSNRFIRYKHKILNNRPVIKRFFPTNIYEI